MGYNNGPYVNYKCFNDCCQEGCPGHKIREKYHRTSDTITFEIDDRNTGYCFDPNVLKAIFAAYFLAKIQD